MLAAVLGIAAYFIITSQIKNSKHVDTSEFLEMVESGDFKEIEVDGLKAILEIKTTTVGQSYQIITTA